MKIKKLTIRAYPCLLITSTSHTTLPTANGSSKQWKWERQLFRNNAVGLGGASVDRTDCLNIFVPKNPGHDVSVTLMVGHKAGVALIYEIGAQIIRA